MFESIGPVWDGNEVWLVVAGGATFAAFPAWYATMFSGFYVALLLVLVFLIVRVVSFEWREKSESPRWRTRLALGERGRELRRVADLGRRAREPRPRRPDQLERRLRGRPSGICSAPTPCFAGIAVVLLFAFHGATFLTLRTTGDLCERARRAAARRLSIAGRSRRRRASCSGRSRSRSTGTTRTSSRRSCPRALGIVALALAVALRARRAAAAGRSRRPASAIVLVVATLFTSLFPRVMVSSTDFANSLTVDGAASAHYTLKVMTRRRARSSPRSSSSTRAGRTTSSARGSAAKSRAAR